MKKRKGKICILCGGKRPNVFGECLCSYDLDFFQDPKFHKAIQIKRVMIEAEKFIKLMGK